MKHEINAASVRHQETYRLSDRFFGKDPEGRELGFTNYYMIIGGKPFLAISGECHYSRVPEDQWEDTILKMRAGGVNVVATYVFWNVHEEVEGHFRWDGRRNLRHFIELCQKHGLYVILRCGPFDHGEMRNGGLPDWLYGKPFDVRSVNEGFFHYVRLLYREIGKQVKGLLYKDGGPIIAAQIDNEYQHSAAPWEMTTGISDEWVPGGHDGDAYMKELKRIAQEEGVITPFYTCTGWGGAATPTDEMMPLWGGYAFWPWMFYGNKDYVHPATPEYIYRDNHNNAVPKTYNFEPPYAPESLPYACCEMGGGMTAYYNYRFQMPFESVDAMANIKLASGCNFLGYYMYRGGNNPRGEKSEFLNEHQCPKISYDYQAPIGEFGQLRPSYFRLRLIHEFAATFAEELCGLVTLLPEGSQDIKPEDQGPLRYALRTDGKRGFLFLNNYQDHAVCRDKNNEEITVMTEDGAIHFPPIDLAAEASAILPFNLDLGGLTLACATAQPLTCVREEGKTTWYFFAPEGMKSGYVFSDGSRFVPSADGQVFERTVEGHKLCIIHMTHEEALRFYRVEADGKTLCLLSEYPLLQDGNCLHIEGTEDTVEELAASEVGENRYTVRIPDYAPCKTALLQIDYRGDIGHIFNEGGFLLEDNFSNEVVWETGLSQVGIKPGDTVTIYITPRKKDVHVDVSSTMAGRLEQLSGAIAELHSVKLRRVTEKTVDISTEAGRKELLSIADRVFE